MSAIPWWGCAGAENEWGKVQFAESSHEYGIIRLVQVGVKYHEELPFDALGLARWYADPTNFRRFEMPLPEMPRLPATSSLFQLGKSLVTRPPLIGEEDPRLRELDDVFDRLLKLAVILHANHFRVGFLTPRNVLVATTVHGKSVLLPDLGFISSGEPREPRWLEDDAEFHDLAYPLTPFQQHSCLGLDRTGPEPDVRLLARLVACVLLGGRKISEDPGQRMDGMAAQEWTWVVPREIPPASKAPWLAAPIWAVLSRAIHPHPHLSEDDPLGPITTVAALAQEMRRPGYRPGDHFRKLRHRKRRHRAAWIALGAAALLSAVTGAAAWRSVATRPAEALAAEPVLAFRQAPEGEAPVDSALAELCKTPEEKAQLSGTEHLAHAVELHDHEPARSAETRLRDTQEVEHERYQAIRKILAESDREWLQFQENPDPALGPYLRRKLRATEKRLIELSKLPASKDLITEEKECLRRIHERLEELLH